MPQRWLALTCCLYALRLAALYHFYFNLLFTSSDHARGQRGGGVNRYFHGHQGKELFYLDAAAFGGVFDDAVGAGLAHDLSARVLLDFGKHAQIGLAQIERAGADVVHVYFVQMHGEDFYGRQVDDDGGVVHDFDVGGGEAVQVQPCRYAAACGEDTFLAVLPQGIPVAFFFGFDDGVYVERCAFQAVEVLDFFEDAGGIGDFVFFRLPLCEAADGFLQGFAEVPRGGGKGNQDKQFFHDVFPCAVRTDAYGGRQRILK